MSEISELGLLETRDAIASGELDPVEAVRSALSRAEADRLNAFTELREAALDEARAAAASGGPLAGVPVAVKDSFVDGDRIPTVGSRAGAAWLEGTAEVVRRVRAAGAVVVGYTNLHEWALGMTSAVTATGPILNPWDENRVPGGSSGGSAAALAAGIVPGALGTDAGGSIRCPSACCGVVGHKPTWGLVPTDGFAGGNAPIDHIGPMARSVEDVAILLEVLAGERVEEPDVRELKLGVARRYFFDNLDPAVAEAVESGIEALTGVLGTAVDVDVAGLESTSYGIALSLLPHTARAVTAEWKDWEERVLPETAQLLMLGLGMSEEDRLQGEESQRLVRAGWDAAFREADVIVTPTLPSLPPTVAERTVELPLGTSSAEVAFLTLTRPMNLGGVPSLSLPCGETAEGWPVSLSITAARGRDGAVIAAGRALEDATGRKFVNRIAPVGKAGTA